MFNAEYTMVLKTIMDDVYLNEGLQDALKDIIMGCNIILDNYFVVGDIVTYNGFTGEVVEFGLKNTKISPITKIVFVSEPTTPATPSDMY